METLRVEASPRPEYLAPDAVWPVVDQFRGTLLAEDFTIKSAGVVLEVMNVLSQKQSEIRRPVARLRKFDAKVERRDGLKEAAMRDAAYLRGRLQSKPLLKAVVSAEARVAPMDKAVKVVDRQFHDGRIRYRRRKAAVQRIESKLERWEPAAERDRDKVRSLKIQIGKYQRVTNDQRRARTLVALRDPRLRPLLLARLPHLATVEAELEELEIIADEILGARSRLLLESIGSQLITLESTGAVATVDLAAGLEPLLGRTRGHQRSIATGLDRNTGRGLV